ncbi:MAG: hypothetical protein A3J24_02220 [Deltaproteobacteria bacterium RIFCSPLOWO2_02_FULL_53_8]|nr:MAG: hypothetical protein A3J24_02220 [Deltaproteobacteria bacterium RIFCSPLOWO2_02_FULL_53_8]
MRLSREQIDKLSHLILETLRDKHLIVIKSDEHKVVAKISEVMLKDMHAEEDLDREVEKVLEAHSREINSGKLDYKRMFTMIKTKLAKERGIVL